MKQSSKWWWACVWGW